jgi:hypothetical protein
MEPVNIPPIPPLAESPQRLSVRFSIDRWDLIRCRLWVVAHHRFLIIFTIILGAGFAMLMSSSESLPVKTLPFRIFYFLVLLVLFLGFMVFFQIVTHALLVFTSRSKGVLGEHEMEIRPEGMLEKSSVSESVHNWAGFHKLGSSRNFLFVYVTDTMVYYIPLKAFPSELAANHFREEILKKANAAKLAR